MRFSVQLAAYCTTKLVSQDPNDEPASVLLDRIRAEREKLNPTKTKRRTSRKKTKQDSSDQLSL